MLYHPDDPLITWLRDGHLDGITLGSRREEVLERWGESSFGGNARIWTYGGGNNSPESLILGFDREFVSALIIQGFGAPGQQIVPRSVGTPPFALSADTSEHEFLDLMSDHGVRVETTELYWYSPGIEKLYETGHGIHAVFWSGFLIRLFLETAPSWRMGVADSPV